MADPYDGFNSTISGPAKDAAAVTPSDSNDLGTFARALYIGGGGDLHVTMAGGSEVTFEDVPAGSTLPIRVKRVHATGTTASSIVALW